MRKLILYHYCCLYFERKIHTKYKKKSSIIYLFNIFVCVKVFFNESEIFSGFSDGVDTKKSDMNIFGYQKTGFSFVRIY